MTTIRLYRAVQEQQGCEAVYREATRNNWGPDKNLPHNDERLLALRAANVELQLAMNEAKGIVEAETESKRALLRRIAGERDITYQLLKSLVTQGFLLKDGDEDEGAVEADEEALWTKDYKRIFDIAMDVDAFNLCVKHTQPREGWNDSGWIYLVYGNSPEELISDHTTNLEQYLKPTFRYIKSFYDPSYIIEGE